MAISIRSRFRIAALVSGATRNLSILTAPGDVSFTLGRIPAKVYWDVAYNLDGGKRFNDTYHLGGHPIAADPTSGQNHHRAKDDLAWLAGFQIGQNVNKGDLSLLANWREVGVSSIDPNLNDSEFALSYLNMRGFRVGLNYNLSSAAVLSLNYYGAWNIDRNLIGGEATGDNAIANANCRPGPRARPEREVLASLKGRRGRVASVAPEPVEAEWQWLL